MFFLTQNMIFVDQKEYDTRCLRIKNRAQVAALNKLKTL